MSKIFKIILVSVFAFAGILLVGNAMDESFDNKDRMLCNSAKVSGNEEYLQKCKCFYAGEPVRCIWGKQK